MASRLKEDEKNERIIRGLLKLPANRRCINCNSLGPQYVCTTFWTFVCTTCGGIHREFTHRVKSVSMAKFTPQEVSSLQSGGNERAKEIYFKELDSHRLPDSSNVDRLRDFIKHVFVDKRYTGERGNEKPPIVKMGDKVETNEHRRANSYGSGSRSPPYEDTYDRRYSDRPSPGYDGWRSPGSEQDSQQNSDYGRSPVRAVPGVVNDWRREDRFGNGRSPEGDSKSGGRSPDSQKDFNVSSPPVIRPVREILGENVTPLRVIEPPKASSGKATEVNPPRVIEPPKVSSGRVTERTASSSSLASSSVNQTEVKKVDSLIDFDADPAPPAPVATQPQQPASALSNTPSSDNWACFDNVSETQVSQPPPPPKSNTLDSALTQLSVTSPAPSNSVSTPASLADSLFGPGPQVSVAPSTVTPSNTALPNNTGTPLGNFSSAGVPPTNGVVGQWSNMQPQPHSMYRGSGSQLTASQFTSSFTGSSNSQGLLSNSVAQISQAGPAPAKASSGVPSQPVDAKTSGRRELPADIFTAMYAPQPVHASGWHMGFAPQMGMQYPMQYNSAMHMPTYSQPTKSANPFDISSESSYAQTPVFPSMMPLQAALPNMGNSTGLVRTSSLGTPAPSWTPPQASPYPSATPQLTPSYGTTAATPGTYMNQQAFGNLPSRPQGFGGFGSDVASYNPMNPTLDFSGNLSAPAAPSPSGNPFG